MTGIRFCSNNSSNFIDLDDLGAFVRPLNIVAVDVNSFTVEVLLDDGAKVDPEKSLGKPRVLYKNGVRVLQVTYHREFLSNTHHEEFIEDLSMAEKYKYVLELHELMVDMIRKDVNSLRGFQN